MQGFAGKYPANNPAPAHARRWLPARAGGAEKTPYEGRRRGGGTRARARFKIRPPPGLSGRLLRVLRKSDRGIGQKKNAHSGFLGLLWAFSTSLKLDATNQQCKPLDIFDQDAQQLRPSTGKFAVVLTGENRPLAGTNSSPSQAHPKHTETTEQIIRQEKQYTPPYLRRLIQNLKGTKGEGRNRSRTGLSGRSFVTTLFLKVTKRPFLSIY